MTDLFEARKNLKPYEYPQMSEYVHAIRTSFWIHKEFDFSPDVQDFKVKCTPTERSIIKRTMLAISQIEVSVKRFWADIYNYIPKPEVDAVGVTFSESEVRHSDAYSHLLDLLGLVEEFEQVTDVPAIQDRIAYLDKYLQRDADDPKSYVRSVLLFSLFIEFVSLFSQFLIMLSFDKYDKRFKGIANAVEATSKEEQIHGMFGAEIINIVQDEHPEWFSDEFIEEIRNAALKAFDAEQKVLDWIFEEGSLEFLPREVIDEFLKDKFNEGMNLIGQDALFETNDDLVAETQWFREEMIMTKGNDFFSKRGTTYSKFENTVTEDDLF